MKVTLKQIAERTGVSINTVSMVLRGMSGISAPTRERVRRAAEEMGYRRQLKPAATKQSLCLVSAERQSGTDATAIPIPNSIVFL